MSFDSGTAEGKLTLDPSGFVNALTKAKGATESFLEAGIGSLALGGLTAATAAAAAGTVALAGALGLGSAAAATEEKAIVGLSNVLKANAVPNYKAVTAEVDAFAGALQRSTGIASESIVDIARQLANLGVASKDLRPATQVVLDFAAAFGIEASTAARAFGQSLNGNAGLLARYLPQVRELTKEQLRAGAAFGVAAKAVNGQAEALGNTFGGRLARLGQSVEDLLKRFGTAFNAAFGPLATEIQGVIDLAVDSLGNGTKGFDLITAAANGAAAAVKSGFSFLVTLTADFLSLRATALEAFASIQSAIVNVGIFLNQMDQSFAQSIAGIANATASFLSAIGAVDSAATFSQLATDAQSFANSVQQANVEQQALADSAVQAAAEARGAADSASRLAGEVKQANAEGKSLATQVKIVADNFGLATAAANGTAAATVRNITATQAALSRAQATVDVWKKVNDAAEKTQGTVQGVAAATEDAASAADDLASSFDDAAASADGAAASAASAGASAAAAGQTFSQQLGRQGSSTHLDFSDPFSAVAQAQNAFGTLQRIQSGAKRADIGFAGVNAASAFAQGVLSQAQASVDRAVAQFTAEALRQLDAAGITDPTARSRIVRERVAEAQRFGVLPPANGLQSFGAATNAIR